MTEFEDSFRDMVLSIQGEVNTLKALSCLRDCADKNESSEVKRILNIMNNSVSILEEKMEDIENYIDNSLKDIESLEEINLKSAFQYDTVQSILKDAPTFMKHSTSTTEILISQAEFLSIPKSTRGRLTLTKIVDGLNIIHQLIADKTKVSIHFDNSDR